jgi:hypothetical protein
MFERFTERARQSVVLAQDEARALKHNYIGTEHLLLGVMRVEEGLAARLLESLGIGIEDVRAQVARIIGQGDEMPTGQIPFTPRAKKVIELSLREAMALKHDYIGTEHILLGIVRENEGVAARILLDFDADADTVRNEVIRMLSGSPVGEKPPRRSARRPEPRPPEPPIPPELAERIDEVRAEKEAAIEAGEFERAASLREEERRLVREARGLPPLPAAAPARVRINVGRAVVPPERGRIIAALVVAALGFPLGLVAGWLIWG